ncbi:MAG: hypothetical protein ACRC7C_18040 [Beijerinckiaceae bacterium]
MRLLLATAAVIAFGLAAPAAEAQQARKKQRGELVVDVKPRSFLDAGTQPLPGTYQGYSTGLTPHRVGDAVVPTGSAWQRLLPGPYGL